MNYLHCYRTLRIPTQKKKRKYSRFSDSLARSRAHEIEHSIYRKTLSPMSLFCSTLGRRLIGNWPNTFAFMKALAEDTELQYSGRIPVYIVQPSIVTSTWREPIVGWADSMYRPIGLLVGLAYCARYIAAPTEKPRRLRTSRLRDIVLNRDRLEYRCEISSY